MDTREINGMKFNVGAIGYFISGETGEDHDADRVASALEWLIDRHGAAAFADMDDNDIAQWIVQEDAT